MGQFDHLKKQLDVSSRTADFFVDGTDIVMTVAYAGKSNKPYWSARQKIAGALDRKVREVSQIPQKSARAGRMNEEIGRMLHEMNMKLFPVFIIKGWSGVTNEDGEGVPFSPEAAAELLDALPETVVMDMASFTITESNFFETMDVGATAKNSESDSNGNSATSATSSPSGPQ